MNTLVRRCFPLAKVISVVNNGISKYVADDIVNFKGFTATYNSILR
jgi:hypothetical protein